MARTNSAAETLRRLSRMLQMIPRGRRIDAATIEGLLANEGISANRRTIQRDLEALARQMPGLCCDADTRPYGWYWDKKAPLTEIPSMGLETAVTLRLVESHLADALPRATLRTLKPYFDRAREALSEGDGTRLARWVKKIRIIPRGQALLPKDVPDQLLETVYTALLEERCIKARYRPRDGNEREYLIHPLGLVLRNGAFILVCTFGEHSEVCQVLLHRMKHAEIVAQRTQIPRGFHLDDHLREGHLSFRLMGKIKLQALIDRRAGVNLHETPISKDQKLTDHDHNHELLEATVTDTVELRAWLHSYGDMLEVLEPKALRREFAAAAKKLAERYQR